MKRTHTAQEGSTAPGRVARPAAAWRARAFVLGGFAFAAAYTTATLALDAGVEHIGPLWMAAIAWTFAASLAGALWRGFHRHDWSVFHAYELPQDDGESHEFTFKTGCYSSLREMEDELLLHDDRRLH